MPSRVFNIPASAPFLPTLLDALRNGELGFRIGDDPLAWAAATLYLPTRRACRLAREAFLNSWDPMRRSCRASWRWATSMKTRSPLPKLPTGAIADEALALPPVLGGLERRLLLASLISKWADSPELHGASGAPLVAQTPAAACALADDLARLIDDMTMRGVAWEKLDGLVPDLLDQYWQLTLKFLQIARERWPQMLRERG